MKNKWIPAAVLIAFVFSLLPSFANTWSPQDFVRLVKTVEIKGEVNQPGIYEVAWDADIEKIIEQAGGANKDADLSSIALAQIVANESVIVIPKKTQKKKISINSADLEELDTLPGIGPAIAQRIIEYRQKTPFTTLDELKEVKGIGDKIFDQIKDEIML